MTKSTQRFVVLTQAEAALIRDTMVTLAILLCDTDLRLGDEIRRQVDDSITLLGGLPETKRTIVPVKIL